MNEDNKICPLLLTSPAITNPAGWVCRKEACAWWVEDKQKCAITAMGGEKRGK